MRGCLAAVTAVALLMGLPSMVDARLPSQRFSAPFTSLHSSTSDSLLLNGCGNNTTTATPLQFNNSSGFAIGRVGVTMAPTSTCHGGGGGTAWRFLSIYLRSPDIRVPTGGLYVLRDVWWVNWFFNYSTNLSANHSHQSAQASAQILVSMWVDDLSTNTSTAQTYVFTSSVGAYHTNASGTVHEATWISLPIVAALTRGQTYQLACSFDVQFVAASGPYPNSAHASFELGTAGRGMALRAITVK